MKPCIFCAILNSPTLTELARPLMSYAKDERNIDKSLWSLPIELFDATNGTHARLAELGRVQAAEISMLSLASQVSFVALRRRARTVLAVPGSAGIDEIVETVLAV